MPDDILFDLNAFGAKGVELAQLAGTQEAAGRVETLTGNITVRHLDGSSATLLEGDEVFMGDTLEVSDKSSIGMIFADETTMSLGSGAEMTIDEMVYDPAGQDGSLALSVANGVFSFVSGQISKTGSDAMTIDTPIATIGIRGTKGSGFAAPEGQPNRISLMAEENGQTGELIVRTQGGVQVLNQPGMTLTFESRFEPPPPPQILTAQQMGDLYSDALQILPPPRGQRPPPREGGEENANDNNGRNPDSNGDGVVTAEEAAVAAAADAAATAAYDAAIASGATEEEAAAAATAASDTVVENAISESNADTNDDGVVSEEEAAAAVAADADTTATAVYEAAIASGATEEEATSAATAASDAVVESTTSEITTDTNGDGVVSEEEAAAVEQAIAASGAFADSDAAAEAAKEAYDAAIEEGASVDEAVAAAMAAGTAVVDGEAGVTAQDELLQQVALNVEGDTGDDPLFSNAISGSLEDSSQSGDNDTFSSDVGELGSESVSNEEAESNDDRLVVVAAEGDEPVDDGALLETETPAEVVIEEVLPEDELVSLDAAEDLGISGFSQVDDGLGLGFGDIGITDPNSLLSGSTDVLPPLPAEPVETPQPTITETTATTSTSTVGITLNGTAVGEKIVGTKLDDNLSGVDGDDWIVGNEGADVINGGLGADVIYGDGPKIGMVSSKIAASGFGLEATGGAASLGTYGSSAVSDGGEVLVFTSAQSDLVTGDSNATSDVFIKNLSSGSVKRISVDAAGIEGNNTSHEATISRDGKYVVFHSDATNLDGSTTTAGQVFFYDVAADSLSKISVNNAGTEGNAGSNGMAISDDGRYVAFFSSATNLVDSDVNGVYDNDTNAVDDIFLHDRTLNTTTRISTDSVGAEATGGASTGMVSMSSDGLYVAFSSAATNLVAGDANVKGDVFVKNTSDNSISRISVVTGGAEATGGDSTNPDITADGRYIVFESTATNLVAGDANAQADIFRHDTTTNTTIRINTDISSSEATGGTSTNATISDDGDYVAFQSSATNLVDGVTTGTHAYVKQISTGAIRVVDKPAGFEIGDGTSFTPKISNDGASVVFESSSTNLVPSDGNGVSDIFMANNPFLVNSTGSVDIIDGGADDDIIVGGMGADNLTGGTGADKFIFSFGEGGDVIVDFTSGQDKIVLDTASFGFAPSSGSSINFEVMTGSALFDGENAGADSSNVIVDSSGDVYVDTNGAQTTGGYSVVANIGEGTAIVASDIEAVD